jgi:hypothetical protein
VLAEIRDITDRYEASQRAELRWRLLGHNLRNVATIIRGNAAVVRDRAESDSVCRAAETIDSSAIELGDIAASVAGIERAIRSRVDGQSRPRIGRRPVREEVVHRVAGRRDQLPAAVGGRQFRPCLPAAESPSGGRLTAGARRRRNRLDHGLAVVAATACW